MMRVASGALFLAVLVLPAAAAAQDEKKKPDDVLQKKDGGIVVGRIQKLDADTVEILVNGEKDARRISLRELNPYSVYKIRLDRIDKSSGEAHFALAEFCMANGLYPPATKEFEEAKRLAAERKYDDANRNCQLLVEKYADTPYFEEAKKLVARIADEVAKENDAKKKEIETKKEEKEKKKLAIAE